MNTLKKAPPESRRGVLLLVVLSTLIVFLLLGTLLLTQSTRSRTAARAFARVTASSASNGALAREMLDEALMQLVRGGTSATESVLGDKYGVGVSVESQATLIDDQGALIQVDIDDNLKDPDGNLVPPPNPLVLNGRYLTFLPSGGQLGDVATYRILRASRVKVDPNDNNAPRPYQLFLANQNPQPGVSVPSTPCNVIINGPEYRSESHDSFTNDNWLTEIREFSDAIPTVARPAFGNAGDIGNVDNDGDGQNDSVDNDGDGVPDGIWRTATWRDEVLPNQISSSGSENQFDVSYLVLDLDSRVNVNIHGPLVRPPSNAWDWSNPPSGVEIVPGFGWGVADINSAALFKDYGTNSLADNVAQYLDGSDVSTGSTASGTRDDRASPYIGDVDGRFGQGGAVNLDSTSSAIRSLLFSNIPAIDMHGLMKVFAVPGSGTQGTTLKYAEPSSAYNPYGSSIDPYLTRLDSGSPRLNVRQVSGSVSENPFSLTELERILRHYDADVNALPQRLAGLLGNEVQRARLFLTTDSWDTPALTGGVADDIIDEISTWGAPTDWFEAPYDVISPDIASGMRFDVNRPFRAVGETPTVPSDATRIEARKQEYCKHLFTLLYAIDNSLGTADVAQWVANVVDYRDSDSNMTRFTFDDDPSDGWDPPAPGDSDWEAKTVWGNERTDLVIGQTLAWWNNDPESALYVMLYRPPVEMVEDENGNKTPAVPLDERLAAGTSGTARNQLDLAKTVVDGNGKIFPVWRLRYDGDDDADSKFVRFDATAVEDYGDPFTATNTSASVASQTSALNDDAYLLIKPGVGPGQPEPENITISGLDTFSVGTNDANYAEGLGATLGLDDQNSSSNAEVHLERLANPGLPYQSDEEAANYNPYVSLGAFPIKPVSRNGNGVQNNWKVYEREDPFWQTPTQFKNLNVGGGGPTLSPLDPTNRNLLLWPNRPFISQVELAMVPPGSGDEVLENYRVPGTANHHYLNDVLGSDANAQALLEATIVPSRVHGSATHYASSSDLESVGFGTAVDGLGSDRTDGSGNPFDVFPLNQLTTCREPGRVNLNLLWTDSDADVSEGYSNHGGWLAMLGQTVTADVATSYNPQDRMANMFDLKGEGGLYVDGDPSSAGTQEQLYPLLAYKTAIKLGNVGTIRSNLFAVWITLKITDTQTLVSTHRRLFAILDRSQPTAFEEGRDLNTKNIIRLKRYLD
jgi:hypothetical protein